MAIVLIKCCFCKKPNWISLDAFMIDNLEIVCDNENCEKIFKISNTIPPLMSFGIISSKN